MKNISVMSLVPRLPMEVFFWAGGISLTLSLWYLLLREQMNLLFAIFFAGSLLIICVYSRATGAIVTMGYLTLMGDLRRMVSVNFGTPKLDLLLLVAPLIAVVLALPVLLELRFKDRLSKAMLALLFVMIFQIFNPQQGGLTVGAAGALFYIVPVLWFWIGRQLASPDVTRNLLYKCIFPLAILAGVMGLCQTFIGFLPYQQAWIDIAKKTYLALGVGTTTRAFGFSVSAAEYATLLMMGLVGASAAYFGSRRLWLYAVPILLAAAVLASGRTLIVRLVFAFAIVYTLRKGGSLNPRALSRLIVLTILGLIGVFAIASHFSSSEARPVYQKGNSAQNALEHQATGLSHPFDEKKSSAGVHIKTLFTGVLQGFVAPLGSGLGATTYAAAKLSGGSNAGSSEYDFSDMFISLGLIGGLLYVYIIFETIRKTVRYLQIVPKEVSLPTLGILASTLSAWLIGGQYATSSLIFFLIGGLVHPKALTPNTELAADSNLK